MNVNDIVWQERHRPKSIEECILPAKTKDMVKQFVSTGSVPNFLFSGTAGVGKTTLARAIANELSADLLFINGSKDSGIDVLRTRIQQFASTVSLTNSKKIVVIDESDYLNPSSSQPAFRAFLEEFNSVTFIFTCNYKNRLIDPLLSRLTVVDFKIDQEEKTKLSAQMFKRACEILNYHQIKFDKKVVAALVTKFFPDFRKTVSELQRYSVSGEIDSGILSSITDSNLKVLFDSIKEKDFKIARQWVADNTPDPTSFFRLMYDNMLDIVDKKSVPQFILLIGEYQFRAAHSIDQEINCVAFIVEVMRSCEAKNV